MKTCRSTIEPLEARIAPATFTVTNLLDSGTGSLRAALGLADSRGGLNTIVFHLHAPPAHGANIITLTSGALTSNGDVTINGPGAGRLIISGGGNSGVFDISNIADPAKGSPTTITGLSIVDGKASFGGGIFSVASLTLDHVVVSGNVATEQGGGVAAFDSATAVSISNSLITGNSAATVGGGLDLSDVKSISLSHVVVTGNSATNDCGGIYASIDSTGAGIAITGSVVSGNTAGFAGGLFVKDANSAPKSKIAISATTISGNTATTKGENGGGGFYAGSGNTVITGSTISNNTAAYNGGGVFARNFTSLTISNCTITGNQTTDTKQTAPYGGGGVSIQGSGFATPQPVKITASHFTGNASSTFGGGVLATGGVKLSISGSTFSGNNSIHGGGIYTTGAGANEVDLTVTGCTISGNHVVGMGGGVSVLGSGSVSLRASKVTGNAADFSGGGINAYESGLVTFKNLVVSHNSAQFNGGGLYINSTPSFKVSGGSIAGNEAAKGGGIYAYDSGGSLLGVAISGNVATTEGGGAFNGGATPGAVTLQLANVIANNAPSGPNTAGSFTTLSSFKPPGSRIAPATITVTNNLDSGTGSLRAALALADTRAGHDTIVFKLPASELVDGAFTITLASELTTKGNVTIDGPGAGKLILNGNDAGRVLYIDNGTPGTDSPVTISGLSIVDGNTSGKGGGIYSIESLTLKNVVVSGNTTSFNGGGVAVASNGFNPKVSISNSLIAGNTATGFSGGLDLFDLKSITLTNTVVTGNTAGSASGGMNAEVDPTTGTGIAITGCQFSGNSATYAGGFTVTDANAAPASKITISATRITGNIATTTGTTYGGGGLLVSSGRTTITGSTISDNEAVYDGGGIDAKGFTSLTISNSTITGNQTTGSGVESQGGGIFIQGSGTASYGAVKIAGSHITDNSSIIDGGGLFAHNGVTLAISGSVVSGNRAGDNGGGICAVSGPSKGVALTVNGGEFSDNTAFSGGGIYASVPNAITITGSNVTGNIATFDGGGITALSSTSVKIKNVVDTDNIATDGGGGLLIANTPSFHVSGGLFAGNEALSGGGIYAAASSGSILGVTISGNAATGEAGGVLNGGMVAGTVRLQIAEVIANSAPASPDVAGPFTFV